MSQDDAFDPTSPSFPPDPPSSSLTYTSYLKVEELLSLQEPLSRPEHHDEHLFILIHQVYELWFKQLLHEVDAAIAALDQDRPLVVHKIFRRVLAIQRVLNAQLPVLETMTPQDFNYFRNLLNPASGFQSAQFRELEAVSGLKDDRFLKLHRHLPSVHTRLARRMQEPTIWDRFVALLGRRGFDVGDAAPTSEDDRLRLLKALKTIYTNADSNYALYLTCEYLIEYDELFQLWRFGHVKMVERTIGARRGTGGSSGSKYLRGTLGKRFFPELWEVRSHLHDAEW